MTKKDVYQAAFIFSVIAALILTFTFTASSRRAIDQDLIILNNKLEEYNDTLTKLDHEQQIVINQLKNHLTDNENKTSINLDNINKIESELIDLKIELHEVSEQSFIYMFDDVYKDIELLRKKVGK